VNQVRVGFGIGSVEVWIRSTSGEAHLDRFSRLGNRYRSGQSRFRSVLIMSLGQC